MLEDTLKRLEEAVRRIESADTEHKVELLALLAALKSEVSGSPRPTASRPAASRASPSRGARGDPQGPLRRPRRALGGGAGLVRQGLRGIPPSARGDGGSHLHDALSHRDMSPPGGAGTPTSPSTRRSCRGAARRAGREPPREDVLRAGERPRHPRRGLARLQCGNPRGHPCPSRPGGLRRGVRGDVLGREPDSGARRRSPSAARRKALLGAVAAGVPFPITGTILGTAILVLSGLHAARKPGR